MKTISNKTRKPLSVPLPGGKKLHLGPARNGQISDNAIDHPPLKKLLDGGDIAIVGDGPAGGDVESGGQKGPSGASGHTPTSGGHRSGDR